MAHYTVQYSCGHGTHAESLFGKEIERQRHIAWMQASMVCPDCYKGRMRMKDANAPKIATIRVVPAAEPIIAIELSGQIEANKPALLAFGYHWNDMHANGVLSTFDLDKPKRALSIYIKLPTLAATVGAVAARKAELEPLGYRLESGLSPLDISFLREEFAELDARTASKVASIQLLADIKAADPRPGRRALRIRIAEIEKEKNARWNGKIYGVRGRFNFYVGEKNYPASDAEVAEREANVRASEAWDAKYKSAIEAAKAAL